MSGVRGGGGVVSIDWCIMLEMSANLPLSKLIINPINKYFCETNNNKVGGVHHRGVQRALNCWVDGKGGGGGGKGK